MFPTLRGYLLRGLAAVLPIGLTVYFMYWLAVTLERLLGSAFKAVLPDRFYLPGLGLALGVALLIVAGIAVNAWVVRSLLGLGGRLLESIPLIKSVYGAVRDLVHFFTSDQHQQDSQRVVVVSFGDARLIGFVTRDSVPELASIGEQDRVAVYLPMSYQVGGYTLFLPRSAIQPLDLDTEDAMRMVLTAGLAEGRPAAQPEPADDANR